MAERTRTLEVGGEALDDRCRSLPPGGRRRGLSENAKGRGEFLTCQKFATFLQTFFGAPDERSVRVLNAG